MRAQVSVCFCHLAIDQENRSFALSSRPPCLWKLSLSSSPSLSLHSWYAYLLRRSNIVATSQLPINTLRRKYWHCTFVEKYCTCFFFLIFVVLVFALSCDLLIDKCFEIGHHRNTMRSPWCVIWCKICIRQRLACKSLHSIALLFRFYCVQINGAGPKMIAFVSEIKNMFSLLLRFLMLDTVIMSTERFTWITTAAQFFLAFRHKVHHSRA